MNVIGALGLESFQHVVAILCLLNTIWLKILDSRFRIQDLRFKKKSIKMHFKACVDNSPTIKVLFHTNVCTVIHGSFS